MRPSPPVRLEEPRLSLGYRLALVGNAGLALTWLLLWVHTGVRGDFWRADFSMFYTGWSMVLHGDGERLYDLDLQRAYQERVVPEREPGGLLPFNYPPHAAVPGALLALLPRQTAFYLWTVVQLLLLAAILARLTGLFSDRPSRWLLVVTVLAFPPVYSSLQHGQMSLLLLFCQTECLHALAVGDDRRAGVAFAVGTIKPQLMLGPLVVVAGARRWRTLAMAAVMCAAWTVLSMLILGWQRWPEWLALVLHSARQSGALGIFPAEMYNLKGMLARLCGDRLTLVNVLSAGALAGGMPALLLVGLWRGKGVNDRPWVVLCLVAGLLLNPHVFPSDVTVVILPAALFLLHLRDRGGAHRLFAALGVVAPLLFTLDRFLDRDGYAIVSPFRLLLVAFAGWALLAMVRERRAATVAR